MAEVETPIVTEESKLATTRTTGSMLERWIEGNPETALKKLETLSEVLARMRLVAIKQTYPSDWVIHTTTDRATGEVTMQIGYLQDSGAERAGKVFGIECGQVDERREDFGEDGTFAYHLRAPAWAKITGEHIDEVIGSRWSGDLFFQRGLDKEAGERVNPVDVNKAAYANLHGRAVRALSGLSAVPLDILKSAGLDTTRCRFVSYSTGAKGGESAGATVGSADVVMPFGNSKGKKASELEDKDLAWYFEAIGKSVADPEKAKYKKNNDRILASLTAEKDRRAQSKAHEDATGTKPASAGEGAETELGKKKGKLWTILQGIADKKAMLLLKTVAKSNLGKDVTGLTELTEKDVDALIIVPKATYTTILKGLEGEGEAAK